MSETQTTPTTGETASPTRESAIEALVDIAQEASTPQAFLKRALPMLARILRCAYIQAELQHAGSVLDETWSHESSDPEFWASTVSSLLVDTLSEGTTVARIFEGRDVDVRVAFLCAPFGVGHRSGGAVVAVLPCRTSDEADAALEQFDVLCTLASSLLETLGSDPQGDESPSGAAASAETVAQIRKVAEFTSETELAFAITNKLRTRDGCEQVVLAAVEGRRVRLLAISGSDSIAPRSPGVKLLRAAAEECADLRRCVVDQDEELDEDSGVVRGGRLHRHWRESVGGGCVASVPLAKDGKLVAVLLVRRDSTSPFVAEELKELHDLVEPYAAGLEMVRVARRSLRQHIGASLRSGLSQTFGRGSFGRKAALLCAALGVGWALYGELPYSVQAPCELRAADARQLSCAADGVLLASHVLPGDTVHAGQVLAEFDTRELELERARLESELAILEVDRFRAMESGSPAEVEMAAANADGVRASLDLVEFRIAAASVTATSDGVILEGDLRSRVGATFTKGEPLFELAPRGSWKLEVRVHESDVDELHEEMSGEFASHSRPEEAYPFVVTRIAPAAEPAESGNVFLIEAECDLPADWARPGMAGFASIDAGERAPAWIALHRIIDYVRLNLWL